MRRRLALAFPALLGSTLGDSPAGAAATTLDHGNPDRVPPFGDFGPARPTHPPGRFAPGLAKPSRALAPARLARVGEAHLRQRDRVLVPAGPFARGSTKGADDERPVRVRILPAFHIDRTEVTRAMYARCVAAKRCPALAVDLTSEVDLPVTSVNWSEARAFCAFAGGRLPTEDEWEKAARGSDGREFPWGNDLDCGHANWGNFENEGPCAGRNPGKPVAVGGYPQGKSPCGALDMAGNVWEWVADRYDRDPTRRVVRGGSCCSYFVGPRAANRNAWDPGHRDGDLGFRCVSR